MPVHAATDFLNPYVSAAIFDPRTGDRVPLWTDVPRDALERAKVPAALQALCFLTSVSVEMSLGPVPTLSATLSPPIDMAKHLLDSALVEYGVAHLQVQFGYASRSGSGGPLLSPLYEGVLMEPEVSFGTEATITLNAQATGGWSAARQKSDLTWDQVPRIDIIRALAKGSNPKQKRPLEVDDSLILQRRDKASANGTFNVGDALQSAQTFGDTAATLQSIAARQIVLQEAKLLYEKRTFAQGYKTDWWAINQLVREARCTCYLQGNKIVLLPMNLSLSDPPSRRFVWFNHENGEIDPAKGIWPILSFSTQTKAVFLPGALRGLAMADVDSETRTEVRAFINDLQAKSARTNEGSAGPPISEENPDADAATGNGGDVEPGSPSDPLAVQQAIAAYDGYTLNMGVQLTLESLVDPTLLPGAVCEVVGVGKRLEGNYGIMGISFNLGEDNTMSLSLVSNVGQLISKTRSEGFEYPEPEGEVGVRGADPSNGGGVPVGAASDPSV
jgi:hypothetical protein